MSESKALEVPIVASKSQVKESVGDITVDEDSFEEEEDDTSFADSGQLPSGTSDVKNVVVQENSVVMDDISEKDEFIASEEEKTCSAPKVQIYEAQK